jgi:N-methylhydantoinase B/oxoprolinase/acetone carboxylase alpha subunit
VRDDVSEGWVSRERAESVYGVVLAESGTDIVLDRDATDQLRRKLKEQQ